jgi:hypothetical protein
MAATTSAHQRRERASHQASGVPMRMSTSVVMAAS